MPQKVVLIVEDDKELNANLSELIELIDFQHESVTDGTIAIERIRQLRPELILLDLQLPNASGLDILTDIRQDFRLYQAKVIVMTGDQFVNLAELHLADGVLIKPFTLQALRNAIETILSSDMGQSPWDKPLSSGF